MKARNFKRWVAGFCATAMLAGAPAMVGYATDIELTRDNTTGETTVKATVVENDNQPTYTIMIPDTVEFGQIQLPTTAADAYVTTSITVKCTNINHILQTCDAGSIECDTILTNHDCRITKMCKQLLSHDLV